MTAPNLKSPSSIIGRTTTSALAASLTDVLVNSAGSNKVYKVNSIFCSNISTLSSIVISVTHRRDGSDRYIVKVIEVPLNATQIVSSTATYFYLEEGDSLRAMANQTSSGEIIIGWEEIS